MFSHLLVLLSIAIVGSDAKKRLRLPPVMTDGQDTPVSFGHDFLELPRANRTKSTYRHRAGRHSGTDLIVDCLVLLDYSVFETMSKNFNDIPESQREAKVVEYMKEYYGLTFAGVAQRYHEMDFPIDSAQAKIRLRMAGIHMATKRKDDLWSEPIATKEYPTSWRKSVDGGQLLQKVGDWLEQQQKNGRHLNVDHVMMFSTHDIYGKSYVHETREWIKIPHAVGLAYRSEICKKLSVSLTEDDMKFKSVSTAAHELAHNLGADHDGEGEGKSCESKMDYIMNAGVTNGNDETFQNQYKFSFCTKNSARKVINALNGNGENCMADTGSQDPEAKRLSDVVPGWLYDFHQQCKIFTGNPESYFCTDNSGKNLENSCRKFKCYNPKYKFCGDFLGNNHALHGTVCGVDKWCENGACVKAPRAVPLTSAGCPLPDAPRCETYQRRECEYFPNYCCNKCKAMLG